MRIVRFSEHPDAEPRWGMVIEHLVYALRRAPYLSQTFDGSNAPEIEGAPVPLQHVELLPPATPSKIMCVGRNYAAHAAELGNEVPEAPLVFLKTPSSLIGPGAPVIHPSISQRVDHEAELALVIGRRCRYLSAEDAMSAVYGYTIANDVTARDLQNIDRQWARAKGFDTFGPLGPWLETDYNPANRMVRCLVNGEVRQESNTDLMIFSLVQILVWLSRAMTLEAGDLVLTGTPAGVAPVKPGDVMTVQIDGLGEISNPVVAEEREE
ncbi:MAG: fumarylacetoacetate hydrolase family protein [Caldilineaceae bacterium]